MGSNQGVVWNDSDLPLQYCVYGAFEQIKQTKKRTSLSPKINLNVQNGTVNLEGFQHINEMDVTPNYAQACVQVPPGRHSCIGLTRLKMNQHKISVRVKVGSYIKYLVKDLVIKSGKDIRLKIRRDLSVKNMGQDEAKSLIQKNEERSEQRYMRQQKIYAQTLQQLSSSEIQTLS